MCFSEAFRKDDVRTSSGELFGYAYNEDILTRFFFLDPREHSWYRIYIHGQ